MHDFSFKRSCCKPSFFSDFEVLHQRRKSKTARTRGPRPPPQSPSCRGRRSRQGPRLPAAFPSDIRPRPRPRFRLPSSAVSSIPHARSGRTAARGGVAQEGVGRGQGRRPLRPRLGPGAARSPRPSGGSGRPRGRSGSSSGGDTAGSRGPEQPWGHRAGAAAEAPRRPPPKGPQPARPRPVCRRLTVRAAARPEVRGSATSASGRATGRGPRPRGSCRQGVTPRPLAARVLSAHGRSSCPLCAPVPGGVGAGAAGAPETAEHGGSRPAARPASLAAPSACPSQLLREPRPARPDADPDSARPGARDPQPAPPLRPGERGPRAGAELSEEKTR